MADLKGYAKAVKGEFLYEIFHSRLACRRYRCNWCEPGLRVQWEYRDKDGKLYTGIARSVKQAEELAAKHGYQQPQD